MLKKKYCINRENIGEFTVYKMESILFPKLVNDFISFRRLIQRYLEHSKSCLLNFIVLDFMFQDLEKFNFIQIKSLKITPQFVDQQFYSYQSRVIKGLEPLEKSCEGCFCQKIHSSNRMMTVFIDALIFSRLLNKNFSFKGVNLDSEFQFQEYLEDLKNIMCNLESILNSKNSKSSIAIGKEIGNKNIQDIEGNMDKNLYNEVNILAPLIEPSLAFQTFSIKLDLKQNSVKSLNTCDLCHKIIKLYMNKKELMKQENQLLIRILKRLKEKKE